jgi:hypothetical protein
LSTSSNSTKVAKLSCQKPFSLNPIHQEQVIIHLCIQNDCQRMLDFYPDDKLALERKRKRKSTKKRKKKRRRKGHTFYPTSILKTDDKIVSVHPVSTLTAYSAATSSTLAASSAAANSPVSVSDPAMITAYTVNNKHPESTAITDPTPACVPAIKAPNSARNIEDMHQYSNCSQKLSFLTMRTVQDLCVLLKDFLTRLHVQSKT